MIIKFLGWVLMFTHCSCANKTSNFILQSNKFVSIKNKKTLRGVLLKSITSGVEVAGTEGQLCFHYCLKTGTQQKEVEDDNIPE